MSGKISIESLIEKLCLRLDTELDVRPVNITAVELYSVAIYNLSEAIEKPEKDDDKVEAVGFMYEEGDE